MALVVEDEYESQQLVLRTLDLAGFDSIQVVRSRSEALAIAQSELDGFDLFIVDRNIPESVEELPASDVGDRLIEELREAAPDRPFLIFTGWADPPLYQAALDQAGHVVITNQGGLVNKLFVLQKDQAPQLLERAQRVRLLLDELDQIEVQCQDSITAPVLRLMRKLASQLGGCRVASARLGGGRSGAGVWRCQIFDDRGTPVANYVVKETTKLATVGGTVFVGLHSTASGSIVAAHIMQVSGMCGRQALDVFQAAGVASKTLWQLAESHPGECASAAADMVRHLSAGTGAPSVSVPLQDAVAAFLAWDEAQGILQKTFQVKLDRGMFVSSVLAQQHGDLHGGNVLVDYPALALIDFDRQAIASRAVDPVTALLSWYLHPDGPGFGSEHPRPEQLVQLLQGMDMPDLLHWECVAVLQRWVLDESAGERDLWATVLGYALRQLRYLDVTAAPAQFDRISALVVEAIHQLER